MSRKQVFFMSLAFMVRVSIGVSPTYGQGGLVGYWKFDEASGTTASDSSGSGNVGALANGVAWRPGEGMSGGALFVDPADASGYCEISTTGMKVSEGTVMVWGKLTDPQPSRTSYFMGHTTQPVWTNRIQLYTDSADSQLDLGLGDSHARQTAIVDLVLETWYHVALTWNNGTFVVYINGDQTATGSYTGLTTLYEIMDIGNDGHDQRVREEAFGGLLDEMKIFDRSLSAVEILSAMEGEPFPFASGPSPKDGTMISDTWVNLTWRAGEFAESHDVYLGDDYDGVNKATYDSEFYRGNQVSTMFMAGFPGFAYPEGLVPGTTYYWRIDEVNPTDPNSPWKGPIWSFSIPPKTAYNPDPADGDGIADTTVTLSWTAGFGAKLHTVFFGDDFDTVANAAVGMPVGSTTHDPGPLEAEKVYYWRVDEFDGFGTYTGDVWAFTTPGAVGSPKPANGAADVSMATVLSWTAADNAASHEVYLGLDKDAVRSADKASPEYKGSKALGAESYDAGLLEPDTTYYWRVDEVYTGNTVKGPIWSFTVGAYLLVDDFESYTDDDPNNEAIWQHWIDGFGVADNGAQVGYLMPPYAEQTMVHGGAQSMPLMYVNENGITNSEASLTLTSPRDWTLAGVAELSLWFRGASSNAADPLYVAIANSAGAPAVVAQDDANAATTSGWRQWGIPLQAFADQEINLTNVDKIAIGLGSKGGAAAGGTGTIFIDDIRLNQSSETAGQ